MNLAGEAVLSGVIFSLATGWYPWGFKPAMPPSLSMSENTDWIMCCGHVLTADEVDDAVADGLLQSGEPDRHGRPTMVLGRNAEEWLGTHWPKPPYFTGR